MLFVADVLELIESQYPDLRADPKRAMKERNYSQRKQLWRVRNDSDVFVQAFDKHAKAQNAAKARGDESQASFEAKMKTKMCRFGLPVQALCKAVEEKLCIFIENANIYSQEFV